MLVIFVTFSLNFSNGLKWAITTNETSVLKKKHIQDLNIDKTVQTVVILYRFVADETLIFSIYNFILNLGKSAGCSKMCRYYCTYRS